MDIKKYDQGDAAIIFVIFLAIIAAATLSVYAYWLLSNKGIYFASVCCSIMALGAWIEIIKMTKQSKELRK